MKIIQINTCNFGSTGKIMYNLASLSEEEGYQVYCCYPKRFSNGIRYSRNDVIIGGILDRNVSSFFAMITGLEDYFFWFTTKLFIRKLRKIHPDVVHLHNLHGSYINYKLLFEYFSKDNVNVIWTLHDCWAITGHCSYFNIIGCEKWIVQCYRCPQILQYPKTYVDRTKEIYKLKKKLFLSVDHIHLVAVSQWISQYIKQSYLNTLNNSIIFNGIDTQIFKPTESMLRKVMNLTDKFVIISVASSWSNDKGLNDFIQLSSLLGDDYVILLVGFHSPIDFPSNIIGIDKTANQKKLSELYSMADVLCSLSYSESFGLTIVESMACGTPAIVYDNSAQRYLVNTTIGRLVTTGDVDGVSNAIIEYRKMSSNDKKIISEICIKYVLENFDMRNCFRQYIDLYRRSVNM